MPGPRYFELVRACPLRSIESDAEHDRALAMMDSLLDVKRRTRDEEVYFKALTDLLAVYEERRYSVPPADAGGTLRDQMEMRGLTLKELSARSGLGVATLSEISTGKRPMTRKHIEKLAAALSVRASMFLD
jgi:antitoxin component HigA of HigAB toxin-antitoxin module